MRKSELEKLRTLNATPAMIRALQEPGTKEAQPGPPLPSSSCVSACAI